MKFNSSSNESGISCDKLNKSERSEICLADTRVKRSPDSEGISNSHKYNPPDKYFSKLRKRSSELADDYVLTCPTKSHEKADKRDPCVCMMAKQFYLRKFQKIYYRFSQTGLGPGEGLENFRLTLPVVVVSGGQGSVTRVVHAPTGLIFAMKIKIKGKNYSSDDWKKEFREIQFLRILKHPFIVKLHHVFLQREAMILMMDFLEMRSLWSNIKRFGIFPEIYSKYFTACILIALIYLNDNGIAYRDLKTENVALDVNWRPKLIDFGMVKWLKEEEFKPSLNLTEEDEHFRKNDILDVVSGYNYARYMAPEIGAKGSGGVHRNTDSWGIGMLLMEMSLGYGVFISFPWYSDPKYETKDWKLTLPEESVKKVTNNCLNFIQATLIKGPNERMPLTKCYRHAFLRNVCFNKLNEIRGPDLSNRGRDYVEEFKRTLFDNPNLVILGRI